MKYDYLKEMDTARLQALLQQESFISDDDSFDDDLIRSIVDILEEREPVYGELDIKASLDRFKSEVVPRINTEISATDDAFGSNVKRLGRVNKKRKLLITVIAAIFIFLLGSTAIAGAIGYDLWKFVTSWGKDTFIIGTEMKIAETSEIPSLVEGSSTIRNTEAGNYQTIEEAAQALNITVLTPDWIPDRFKLTKVETLETPMYKGIITLYQNDGKVLIYNASAYFDKAPSSAYEMDEGSGEVLKINNIDHYIMTNSGQISAVWIRDKYVYSMNGDVSREEIIKILNSMYEGEQ